MAVEVTRREVLMGLGAAAGAAVLGLPGEAGRTLAATLARDGGYDADKGEYVLPPLPYAHDALEAAIDAQTMQLHHGKHHLAYVNGLNAALKKLAEARQSGDFALVQHLSRQVAFHGGGHALHTIFWNNMGPVPGEPTGPLKAALERDFGSVEAFKAHFSAAAAAVEGGGWGILGLCPMSGRLVILQGENQQKLTIWGMTPLLVLDVWEHAYYLRYQNRRGDYIKAWWQVVNWDDVARRLAAATGDEARAGSSS